jgi:hypothetical protein
MRRNQSLHANIRFCAKIQDSRWGAEKMREENKIENRNVKSIVKGRDQD